MIEEDVLIERSDRKTKKKFNLMRNEDFFVKIKCLEVMAVKINHEMTENWMKTHIDDNENEIFLFITT